MGCASGTAAQLADGWLILGGPTGPIALGPLLISAVPRSRRSRQQPGLQRDSLTSGFSQPHERLPRPQAPGRVTECPCCAPRSGVGPLVSVLGGVSALWPTFGQLSLLPAAPTSRAAPVAPGGPAAAVLGSVGADFGYVNSVLF